MSTISVSVLSLCELGKNGTREWGEGGGGSMVAWNVLLQIKNNRGGEGREMLISSI